MKYIEYLEYIIPYIYFAGTTLGFFITVIILNLKNKNKIANFFFSLILIKLSITGLILFLYSTKYFFYISYIKIFAEATRMTIGPFLYLFVKAHITYKFKVSKKDLMHFVPLVMCLILLIPIYIYYSDNMSLFVKNYENFQYPMSYIYLYLRIIQSYIYFIVTINLLRQHEREMQNNASSALKEINLSWLKNLLYFNFFIITNYIIWTYYMNYNYPDYQYLADDIVNFLILIVCITACYKGITQGNIFDTIGEIKSAGKYKTSPLTENASTDYMHTLKKYLEKEKVYRDNDLTMGKLASDLNIPSFYISQTLNQKLKLNFYDFINLYRIEEAKELLSSKEHSDKSILEILLLSGFNSKSVFNTFFKKQTGMTPSAYRKAMDQAI